MSPENEVFRKIKEMSKRVANPRPYIPVNNLASELLLLREQLLPAIGELKRMRLVQHDTLPDTTEYVKLTLLGCSVTRG